MNQEFLQPGENAPDFTLPDSNNNTFSFSDYKNKNIVLWFFPKASTPGWTIQGEGFRDEFKSFQDKGYHIIGVSADSPTKQQKFVEKYNFPYPMLCDENHDMLKKYKAWGLKKFMGKEYKGIYRISYLIDENGIIEKAYEKVKPKEHAIKVLEDIG